MFKYSVEFEAFGLDEGALRDALERLNVFDATVSRVRVGRDRQERSVTLIPPSNSRSNDRRTRILSFFQRPGIVARSRIVSGMSEPDQRLVQRDLTIMVEAGTLHRVGHGLYASAAYPRPTKKEIDEFKGKKRVQPSGKEDEATLEFLCEPRNSHDLRQRLKVTRQRVDQICQKLLDRGLIFRGDVPRGRGRARQLFCTDPDVLRRRIEELENSLSDGAMRLLAVMPDEGWVKPRDAAEVAELAVIKAADMAEELERFGLAEVFKLGGSPLVRLTEDGRAHHARLGSAKRADAVDPSEMFGTTRGNALEVLAVLGQAQTRDMTFAVRARFPDDVGCTTMGQVVQRLKGDNLIQSVDVEKPQPAHELSEYGHQVWEVIRPYRSPISRERLVEMVRVEAKKVARDGAGCVRSWRPSKRAIAMMAVLEAMGPAVLTDVVELMNDPFENPRSADLAMKTLREAGFVDREGEGGPNAPYRYRLTEDGAKALRDVPAQAGVPMTPCIAQ